jgi:glycine/D-amino acid oxidase-like deaminating enzyme
MTRLCHPFSYGDGPVEHCFWNETVPDPGLAPLSEGINAEVAVIGAGFTGLSAALHLAEAGVDVVVVDEKQPGWGASGRNGGFCCLGGSMLGAKEMIKRHGEDAARDYALVERDAVDLVDATIDQLGLEVDRHSNGETILAHRKRDYAGFATYAESLAHLHGQKPQVIPQAELSEHGMGGDFHGAMTTPIGFALNPRKYVIGLMDGALAAGARIFGNTPVTGMETGNGTHTLTTPKGRIAAKKVILATNGYSSETLPNWMAGRYLPAQSSVIVTRPLSSEEREAQGWTTHQMCYDTRNLLHYFRLMPNGQFLFGMRGGLATSAGVHHKIRAKIRGDFERMFPAWAHVETPWYWSGFVCLSPDLTPFAGPVPGTDGLFAGFAYHGNGVAMGSYCGALLANRILGRATLPSSAVIETPPARMPGGRFRRLAMWPAYLGFALADL